MTMIINKSKRITTPVDRTRNKMHIMTRPRRDYVKNGMRNHENSFSPCNCTCA